MKAAIKKIMYERDAKTATSPLAYMLWILSLMYCVCVGVRNRLYDVGVCRSQRVAKPVICVGNIVMGGTGKTPTVEYLLRFFNKQKKSTVVLTRGYMPQAKADVVSDEVAMLKRKFPAVPLLVGANRYQSAQHYLQSASCDVFVMDDGFQHRQLYRDLNIVVVDATNPFGNGFLIPRGILREPIEGVRRADCIVLTKVDQARDIDVLTDRLLALHEKAIIVHTEHRPVSLFDPISAHRLGLSFLENKNVYLMSGIGNPKGFTKTVEILSANVVGVASFDDHAVYSEQDVNTVVAEAVDVGAEAIVITEKDAVKVEAYFGLFAKSVDLVVLGIEMKIVKGEELLYERLADLL